jgi:hypothetical protein
MAAHAGNTILYEHMALERRHVDGSLIWPESAVAERPHLQTDILKLERKTLLDSLDSLDSVHVVWLGALFELRHDAPEISAQVTSFDKRVRICYEC